MLKLLAYHIPERMEVRGDSSLPLYVSVAGYDIAWLHIRLDNTPKYYRFKEYKQAFNIKFTELFLKNPDLRK